MVVIIPFKTKSKFRNQSVEQLLVNDYKAFMWVATVPNLWGALKDRVEYVHFAANNFIPQVSCSQCDETAEYISIYNGWNGYRSSWGNFVYCGQDCFSKDPQAAFSNNKAWLHEIKFDTALSSTQYNTNSLIEVLARCAGIKEGRRTKEYLDDFFTNQIQLKRPYGNPVQPTLF